MMSEQHDPLARLTEVRRARQRLDRDEIEAVAAARSQGLTWERIGDALGMRGQHACRKFRALLVEQRTVTAKLAQLDEDDE